MIDPTLLAVSRGDAPADLLLANGRVVNVFSGEIEAANVAIHAPSGRIAGVGDYARAAKTIDLRGSFIAPGFIDAHMHVESTMLPPSEFVTLALPRGTTGAVFDPHEIANVLGIPGIRYIMDDAAGLPFESMFALSSCVPASHLETSGARLEARDLAPLFDDPRVVALAEMMNFPGAVSGAPEILAKIALGLQRHVVDGHAPGLSGKPLQAYIATGISTDHECTTRQEALERLGRGVRIFIREGSAARNLESLLPAVNARNAWLFSFCTDDRHPADLKNEGHIDHVVRRAVALGLDPVTAIAMAGLHTARHYRRADLGAVAPGYLADLIVFDDLEHIVPRSVFVRGTLVAVDGACVAQAPRRSRAVPPASYVRLPPGLSAESFRISAARGASIRVIGMHADQLVTDSLLEPARPVSGEHRADPSRDLLKLAVIERHRSTGNIGLGFVKGFGLREGAIASTVGHDSHNLAVVGASDADMLAAARTLEHCGGGQCVVKDGAPIAVLPLPIAGLMSDQPASTVIDQQARLLAAARSLGCPHPDPFMPLSFLPLAVIPKLKLTDRGLVDVEQFALVPLEM